MKAIYCSKCHKKLKLIRKAIPDYGRVIELIEPHECGEIVPIDLGPKLVRNSNDLEPTAHASVGSLSTADFRDRRKPEDVKSSAPLSLIDQIQGMKGPEDDMS